MAEEGKRSKKSANYVLEQMLEQKEGDNSPVLWSEIKDGFTSPRKALEHAESQKITGVIRVVRIASEVYGGEIVTPDPIFSLRKIVTEEPKVAKTRKPRKPRQKSVYPCNTQAPLDDDMLLGGLGGLGGADQDQAQAEPEALPEDDAPPQDQDAL
jgi:hypothetical protein